MGVAGTASLVNSGSAGCTRSPGCLARHSCFAILLTLQ
jgi:hypothetical protein